MYGKIPENAIKMTHSFFKISISQGAISKIRRIRRMKRKVFVWMMAAAVTLSVSVPVSAAVTNRGNAGRYFADANGDGICDNFIDQDGDGICDNCVLGTGRGLGRGRYFVDADGDGICDYFVDKNGDGICDYTAGQCGRGMRRESRPVSHIPLANQYLSEPPLKKTQPNLKSVPLLLPPG